MILLIGTLTTISASPTKLPSFPPSSQKSRQRRPRRSLHKVERYRRHRGRIQFAQDRRHLADFLAQTRRKQHIIVLGRIVLQWGSHGRGKRDSASLLDRNQRKGGPVEELDLDDALRQLDGRSYACDGALLHGHVAEVGRHGFGREDWPSSERVPCRSVGRRGHGKGWHLVRRLRSVGRGDVGIELVFFGCGRGGGWKRSICGSSTDDEREGLPGLDGGKGPLDVEAVFQGLLKVLIFCVLR